MNDALVLILRVQIPAVGTLWLVYYRTYKMRSASKQLVAAKKKVNVTGYDIHSLQLAFKYFGFRILATAGGWFIADVYEVLILRVLPMADLQQVFLWQQVVPE